MVQSSQTTGGTMQSSSVIQETGNDPSEDLHNARNYETFQANVLKKNEIKNEMEVQIKCPIRE